MKRKQKQRNNLNKKEHKIMAPGSKNDGMKIIKKYFQKSLENRGKKEETPLQKLLNKPRGIDVFKEQRERTKKVKELSNAMARARKAAVVVEE
jgi:hypothetical protein